MVKAVQMIQMVLKIGQDGLGGLDSLSNRAREGGREGRTHAHAIAHDRRSVKCPATRTGARVRPVICPFGRRNALQIALQQAFRCQKVNPDKAFLRAWRFSFIKMYCYALMKLMKS